MVQRTVEPIFGSDSGVFAEEPPGKGTVKPMFSSIARLYQAWKRHGAVRRELSHLTDRELADIGITRSDIDRIASEEANS